MITIQPTTQPATAAVVAPTAQPDLYVCPFTVIEDNAEQLPWTFQGVVIGGRHWLVKRQRRSLDTGDYSIAGHESFITVERKSPQDLVGSVTAGHARFLREHERMAGMVEAGGFACLVCEGSLDEIDDELRQSDRRGSAETLMGCLASWPMKFRTPWFFAGDRRRAELLAFRLMLKWWLENVGEEAPRQPQPASRSDRT